MTEDEALARYTLHPTPEQLPEIRALLRAETSKERASQGHARAAMRRIVSGEAGGDFDDFTLQARAAEHARYYGVAPR